jgi:hypothetical protein
MKKVMRILGIMVIPMLALGLGILAPVEAQGEVSARINAPDKVEPGVDFTATVDIGQVVDLNAAQYDITYDPLILRLNSTSPGQIDSTEIPVMFNEISPGTCRVVQFMLLGKVSGSGTLSVLHFDALAAGRSDIKLSNGLLSGMAGEIPAAWTGDSVEANKEGSPPTIPPSPEQGTTGQIAESGGEELIPATPSSEPAPTTGGTISESDDGSDLGDSTREEAPAPLPVKPANSPLLWGVMGGVAGLIALIILGKIVSIFIEIRRRRAY